MLFDAERLGEVARGAGIANLLASLFPTCVMMLGLVSRISIAAATLAGAWAFGISAAISFLSILVSEGRPRTRSAGGGTALVCVLVAQGLFYLQAFGQSVLLHAGR